MTQEPLALRVSEALTRDVGRGLVRLDPKDMTGLGIDTGRPARRSVVLQPLGDGSVSVSSDLRHVTSVLEGLPVSQGDKVRSTFMGGVYREFSVVETNPRGPVLIASSTAVKIKGESVSKPGREATGVTYEDIGGLRKQMQRNRGRVEMPLRPPELFDRLGIEPPKGVLLYGPPGCGKTLVAKALANETSAYFTHIGGPEVMGKYYGESEERAGARL